MNNFNGPRQTPFFADPSVRAQLRLNDQQFNQLNTAYQRAFQRYDRSLRGLGTGSSAAQRQQRLANTAAARSGAARTSPGASNSRVGTTNNRVATTGEGNTLRTGPATGSANAPATGEAAEAAVRRNSTTEATTGTGTATTGTSTPNTGTTATNRTPLTTGSNLGTATDEQSRLAALQRFNTEFNSALDTAFTDPTMRDRFNQLNLQFRGIGAFNDPALQRQLNLTAQQRQQLASLNGQWRRDLMNLQRANRSNLSQQQLNDLRARFATQLNGILTPEQQQQWTQMTGQPFDFPVTTFFPTTPATGENVVPGSTDTRPSSPQSRAARAPQTQPVR
jgi:hypothetical protein